MDYHHDTVIKSVRLSTSVVQRVEQHTKSYQSFSRLVEDLLIGYLIGRGAISHQEIATESIADQVADMISPPPAANPQPPPSANEPTAPASPAQAGPEKGVVDMPDIGDETDNSTPGSSKQASTPDDAMEKIQEHIRLLGEPKEDDPCPCGSGSTWYPCHSWQWRLWKSNASMQKGARK